MSLDESFFYEGVDAELRGTHTHPALMIPGDALAQKMCQLFTSLIVFSDRRKDMSKAWLRRALRRLQSVAHEKARAEQARARRSTARRGRGEWGGSAWLL